ncbi:unnamed protein product (macronuclear) [Paramecium tetraurelia]|uniref:Uncharacterized protein n=1 Tax=Paramecium tetraurelia TaxID=5888 RepID=A0CTH1_PARTE|nr:uncharacterized protein GSPATT00010322001 [Paramecium tetraurelia]CAK74088.1 unnamed protein product [Paramecium tetraurelia]|eukprot:XP_001441485.1 hypothetical protein (macronuclear) [Paramecium tetraurelia strain d4-2]
MFRRVFGISNKYNPTRLRYLRELQIHQLNRPKQLNSNKCQINTDCQFLNWQLYQEYFNQANCSDPKISQILMIIKHTLKSQKLLFRQSQQSQESLAQFAQSLEFKIPEIAKLTNDARKQAAQELFIIYLEGIHYDNLVSPGYVEQLESTYRERTTKAIKQIQAEVKDPQLAAQLSQSLEQIFQNYQFNQGRYVGLIKSFIDALQGTEIQVAQKLDQKTQEKQLFIQTVDKATKKFSAEDQEYARNVDGHDYKLFLQELYEKEYQSGFAQNRFNEKGQKLVYESQAQEHHEYLLVTSSIYSTEVMPITPQFLAVPVVAAAFFYLAKQGQAKRAIPFVRQVLKNTDNTYEVVFEQNRIISRIENVQSSQIKLAQDTQFANSLVLGTPTDFGYHVKVADNSFIAPYLYRGNGLDFRAFINV